MIRGIFFSVLLLASMAGFAQPAPLSADEILQEAYQQAKHEKKNVFIMFHASWCGWCHKMDSSINDVSCKKYFDDNFVIRHIVVDESDGKKQLENPGGAALRNKYYGEGQGIPFWLIFDENGNLLSDSKIRKEGDGPEKGDNAGCPANEKEVDFFIAVLKKTSTINSNQIEAIRKRFRKNDLAASH